MSSATGQRDTRQAAAEFVAKFEEAWARPTPDRLVRLLSPGVRLSAPLMETTVGVQAAREEFSRLFDLIPDVRGTVHRWGADGDAVFIEFTLAGTLAGRPLEWRAVDRFLLEDGLATERVTYFDPLSLMTELARRPSSWLRWWRSGLGPPASRRRLLRRRATS